MWAQDLIVKCDYDTDSDLLIASTEGIVICNFH